MAGESETTRKTFYPETELAEWIEKSAEESSRSESRFVQMILQGAADSVGGEPIDIHEYTAGLKPE